MAFKITSDQWENPWEGRLIKMKKDQYVAIKNAIQKLVDDESISVEFGKRMIDAVNKDARSQKVPIKFDKEEVEITPSRYNTDVTDDIEDYEESYSEEESSY